MYRMTADEKEALRLAATAAVPILTRLRQERADLEQRIEKYQHIVEEYETSIGARRPRRSAEGDTEGPRRGMVNEHIDAVLGGGGDFKEPEIRRAIWERFAIKYSRATTYTALRRGDGKKYEQKEKRWRMKTT
jgi:hypothetical protein